MLGLIFLKFADNNYRRHEADIFAEHQKLKGTRREKRFPKSPSRNAVSICLLSRLISGKLPVENLAIQFPPGMAEEMEAVK